MKTIVLAAALTLSLAAVAAVLDRGAARPALADEGCRPTGCWAQVANGQPIEVSADPESTGLID